MVAGVRDLTVCMKDTGMEERLMLPSTMLTQNTQAIGNTRAHRSDAFTSTRGFSCGRQRQVGNGAGQIDQVVILYFISFHEKTRKWMSGAW